MLLVFENAPLQVSRWLLHTVMQLPSRVCCHFGHDTFLLADDSFKEGDLQEKRKQRYWSAFQSVLTVLMTVMTAVSVVVVTRLMQRAAV
jgi:hypothetical protein